MTGDELTPDRLDRVLDSGEAASDEERAMLALAAQLRAEVPAPSQELRGRVAALGEPTGRAPRTSGRRGWLVAAPALGALVVAIVGTVALLNTSNSGPDSSLDAQAGDRSRVDTQLESAGTRDNAAAPAQSTGAEAGAQTTMKAPATASYRWQLPAGEIAATIDDLREIAEAAQTPASVTRDGAARIVRLQLPESVRADVIQQASDALRAHQGTIAGAPMDPNGLQQALEIVLIPRSP